MPTLAFPWRYRPPVGLAGDQSGLLSPFEDDTPDAFDPSSLDTPSQQPQSYGPPPPMQPAQAKLNDTQAGATLATPPPLNPGEASNSSLSGVKRMPPPGGPSTSYQPPPPPGAAQLAPRPSPPQNIGDIDQQVATSPTGNPVNSGPIEQPQEPTTPQEKLKALRDSELGQSVLNGPKSNWAQRLGMAILSATRLAPAANAIVHPKYTEQARAFATQEGDLEEQQKELIQGETAKALEQQRIEKGELNKRMADPHYGQEQIDPDYAKQNLPQLIPDASGQYWVNKGTAAQLAKPERPENDRPISVAPGASLVDPKTGKPIYTAPPKDEKPTAEKAADVFESSLSKMAQAGELPPQSASDVNALTAAIRKSKTLSPEERSGALAYAATHPTPASTASAGVQRMVVVGQNREYPVINKANGQLEMRSATEINASPGNFAPAGQGASAMSKGSIFQDLHYNIDTARKAVSALGSLDAPTRLQLSYTLRHTDPASAMQTFLAGESAAHLTPQQQEAVQALALLSENAMSLRSVAGMGQGSQDLRDAIQATLPSGKSADVPYMMKQLEKFEGVVNRLETGVPGMGNAGRGGPTAPSGGKQLDAHTAAQYLQKAGGDKEKARQSARADGYTF